MSPTTRKIVNLSLLLFLPLVSSFQITPSSLQYVSRGNALQHHSQHDTPTESTTPPSVALSNHPSRRKILQKILTTTLTPFLVLPLSAPFSSSRAHAQTPIQTPDFVQEYADFIKTDEGWSYKDVKVGSKEVVIEDGDRVVFDWSGYTIGYFGRPFEAKGGPQGGAFDKELDYFRTVVGSGTIVKGLECALRTMGPGGIRQVIVPFGELSYPTDDLPHEKVGPKPTTFSGQRALNFVLENPRVDRTLLFNVKVIRVDKKDGKGGFIRG